MLPAPPSLVLRPHAAPTPCLIPLTSFGPNLSSFFALVFSAFGAGYAAVLEVHSSPPAPTRIYNRTELLKR